ncbi:hypothetical protein [Streptomyces sp. 150FB]|uniref:hypothetical protein n=1 Tax=Streptomyces sp. 150FB TaxID=1576605 RepID=UPI00069909D1|nr:hypothetical protein [Streptomyces sp. 150FB]
MPKPPQRNTGDETASASLPPDARASVTLPSTPASTEAVSTAEEQAASAVPVAAPASPSVGTVGTTPARPEGVTGAPATDPATAPASAAADPEEAEGPDPEEATETEEASATAETTASSATPATATASEAAAAEETSAVAVTATATLAPNGSATRSASLNGLPKKPALAAAAIVGAVLLAIPVLVARNGGEPQKTALTSREQAASTVLEASPLVGAPGNYATEAPPSPSPSPSKVPTVPKAPLAAVGGALPSHPTASPKPSPHKEPKKATKPKAPVWTTTQVSAVSKLFAGQSWKTNRIRLTMQGDGNLVVYNEKNNPTWATMTFGQNYSAWFQEDGNLVVYTPDHRAVWASNTYTHPGAKLVLEPDGNVRIKAGGTSVWATH